MASGWKATSSYKRSREDDGVLLPYDETQTRLEDNEIQPVGDRVCVCVWAVRLSVLAFSHSSSTYNNASHLLPPSAAASIAISIATSLLPQRSPMSRPLVRAVTIKIQGSTNKRSARVKMIRARVTLP